MNDVLRGDSPHSHPDFGRLHGSLRGRPGIQRSNLHFPAWPCRSLVDHRCWVGHCLLVAHGRRDFSGGGRPLRRGLDAQKLGPPLMILFGQYDA